MKLEFKNILGRISVSLVLLTFGVIGCKKLVDVNPPATSVTGGSVYSSDATATAVITGLYIQLSKVNYGSGSGPNITNFSMWAGLSADELTLWNGIISVNQIAYFKNALSINAGGYEFWNTLYPYIFICNSAIEGLNEATALSPAVKQQLLGEAKFMRAFYYFYLVNLYGDVPLALNTDYTVNARLSRTPKAQVYQQIITDLKDAQNMLNNNYLAADAISTTTERLRPTKWAATALLARAYLYTNKNDSAEVQATLVINNSTLFSLSNLNNVFLKNSNEAIWQLQPVTNGTFSNTADAPFFILSFAPAGVNNSHPVYLSSFLVSAFESGDNRRVNWVKDTVMSSVTYSYPNKYKATSTVSVTATEYTMLLRLGEQYLIRAEARAQQGNISGAQSDLNSIRTRAGLPNTTANSQTTLLATVLHERQVELFAELGQRWFDLKRTGTIDAVMSTVTPIKGGSWNPNWALYPLPITDLQKDLNLRQNPGY